MQPIPSTDTLFNDSISNLVKMAGLWCQAPAAILVFAEGDLGMVKAATGTGILELIDFNILVADVLQQENTAGKIDYIQVQHPLLLQHQYHFFTAHSIRVADTENIVFLCLLHHQYQSLTSQQQEALALLGKQIALELNKQRHEQESAANAARQVSREQVRSLFRRATDAVVIINAQGQIIQWNPKAEKIFGWQAGEVAGRSFEQLCLTEESWLQYNTYKAIDNGDDELIEITALHKGGALLEIRLGMSAVIYNSENFNVLFISDVTEYRQATSRLDKQKAFYENILNKIPTDIAVFDADHRYLFVNPGAIKNPEYRKAIVGKDDYEYAAYRGRDATVADFRRSKFTEMKTNGQEVRWEDSLRNPEGQNITHMRRLFPVHNETGELDIVIGFGVDITDRIAMEEKQSILVRQLSAQNAQLVDFCNIVSHNLRGPLVNMSMLVQFINESEDNDEQKFLITKLQPVIDNLHTTFNELVESIQIRQDAGIPSEKINLSDCMQRTLAGLEMEINKTGAVIETDFEEAQELYYPPKYLFSIFHNLLGNSIKYRSPNRSPHVKVVTRRDGDTVTLSVSDNGLGLDVQKHKDSLFKIGKVFHRHPNAKGFGLFMTKTQIDAMNGRIWAESKPDEGTTFFVEFTKQSE